MSLNLFSQELIWIVLQTKGKEYVKKNQHRLQ